MPIDSWLGVQEVARSSRVTPTKLEWSYRICSTISCKATLFYRNCSFNLQYIYIKSKIIGIKFSKLLKFIYFSIYIQTIYDIIQK